MPDPIPARPSLALENPLSHLHVSRWKRKKTDEGFGANAMDGGADDDFDRDAVRAVETVVEQDDLQ